MQFSLALHVVAVASMLLAGCVTIKQCSDVDEDPNEGLPFVPAPSATTTYGTVCYSVQFQSKLRSIGGCQTQAWKDRELHALRYGEFVFPMSQADLGKLYANPWDERGLLRDEVSTTVRETPLLIGGPETLRGMIEVFVVTSVFDNLIDGGEFSDVQEVQYWARFCANATADDCKQSAAAASWEANAARIVFQPIAR